MINWQKEKVNLQELISKKVSYEEIGKMYGCTGGNIRRRAKHLGIYLEQRRKINENETFNKNTGKKCPVCGKPIRIHSNFCSHECYLLNKDKENIESWKKGEISGADVSGGVKNFLKKYLLEKNNYKCEKCGFDKLNEYTGKSILQVHHKDGNCLNNSEENLELLCPNCHCLTENWGNRNHTSARKDKRTKYYRDLVLKGLI